MCGAFQDRFFIDCKEPDRDTKNGICCTTCGVEVTYDDWNREMAWKAALLRWLKMRLPTRKTAASA